MKYPFPLLIGELGDWINKLDDLPSFNLTPMEGLQLRDLLIQARKQLIENGKELKGNEQDSEMKKQVQAEIVKQMARLNVKG